MNRTVIIVTNASILALIWALLGPAGSTAHMFAWVLTLGVLFQVSKELVAGPQGGV